MSSTEVPPPELTPELAAAIERGYAVRDRANMQPTIDYFTALLERDPEHPVLLYEVGGAYDTAGQEELASAFYQQALERGLSGDVLRRCLIQYGSTLRNLDRYEESVALLEQARSQFPGSYAVRTFLALSLLAAGRSDAAVAELLLLVADRLDTADISRYHAAIRGNAEALHDRDAAHRSRTGSAQGDDSSTREAQP